MLRAPHSPYTDVRTDGPAPTAPTPPAAAGALGCPAGTHRGAEGAGEGAG